MSANVCSQQLRISVTRPMVGIPHYCNFALFRFGFFQDGDVGVGVFREREEIFVGGKRPNASGISIRA